MAKVSGWSYARPSIPAPFMPPLAAGRFYHSPLGVSITTVSPGEVFFAIPFYVPALAAATTIAVEITSAAGAGSKSRLGIYADLEGFPDLLLLDAGTVDIDSTGAKSISISKALRQGWYWTAYHALQVSGFHALRAIAASGNNLPMMGFAEPLFTLPPTAYTVLMSVSGRSDYVNNGFPGHWPIVSGQTLVSISSGAIPRILLGF